VKDLPKSAGNIDNTQLNLNTYKSNSKIQYELKGSKQTLMRRFYNLFNFKTVRGTSDGVSYNIITKKPFPGHWYSPGAWDYMRRSTPQVKKYPGKGFPPN